SFQLEVVFDTVTLFYETPPILPLPFMANVVTRTLLWITKNRVGFQNDSKAFVIAGLLVVRVKALCQQSKDAINRLGLSTRTYLQYVVVVFSCLFRHKVHPQRNAKWHAGGRQTSVKLDRLAWAEAGRQ